VTSGSLGYTARGEMMIAAPITTGLLRYIGRRVLSGFQERGVEGKSGVVVRRRRCWLPRGGRRGCAPVCGRRQRPVAVGGNVPLCVWSKVGSYRHVSVTSQGALDDLGHPPADRRRAQPRLAHLVRFEISDAERLPIDDATVDTSSASARSAHFQAGRRQRGSSPECYSAFYFGVVRRSLVLGSSFMVRPWSWVRWSPSSARRTTGPADGLRTKHKELRTPTLNGTRNRSKASGRSD
jgi:hypothetical protein